MKRTDKIAILMAAYNGEPYIASQIDSILKQTSDDWILYIHDDGSGDNTERIIDTYCSRYPDKIIKIPGKPTGGAKENFLFLMENVDAPYLMFSDQDDIWLKDKVAVTFETMKKTENHKETIPVLVYSELKVVDENENVIAERMCDFQQLDMHADDTLHLLMQNIATGCTIMINRALKEKALQVEDPYHMIMHDWWLALTASYFGKMAYIDTPLTLYRQHITNNVGAKNPYSPGYILKKLSGGGETKKVFEATRAQARLFKETYGLSNQSKVGVYGNLSFHTKVARWAFYTKNKMWRKPWVRKITQMIYG
jgi:glycosyltransferase involved in cell wall biosynthesis